MKSTINFILGCFSIGLGFGWLLAPPHHVWDTLGFVASIVAACIFFLNMRK